MRSQITSVSSKTRSLSEIYMSEADASADISLILAPRSNREVGGRKVGGGKCRVEGGEAARRCNYDAFPLLPSPDQTATGLFAAIGNYSFDECDPLCHRAVWLWCD